MGQIKYQGQTFNVPNSDSMTDEEIEAELIAFIASEQPPQKTNPILETADEAPAESGFSQGFGELNATIFGEGIVGKAGGMIFEKAVSSISHLISDELGNAIDAGTKYGRETEKYQKWKPLIWKSEDAMNKIRDKKSPEYQTAWEQNAMLKKNLEDDLAGKYEESEVDFSIGSMLSQMKESPGVFAGAMTKAMIQDPALLLVPGGMLKAGNAAVKVTQGMTKAAQVSAKLAAQATGAGTIGAGFGAGADIVEQLDDWGVDEDPDAPGTWRDIPIDFDRVGNTMVMAGGLGFALPFVGAGASVAGKSAIFATKKGAEAGRKAANVIADTAPGKKLSEVMTVRQIKAVERDAQRIFIENIDPNTGRPTLNKSAAIREAVSKHNKPPEFEGELSDMDVFMSEPAIASRIEADLNAPVTTKLRKAKDATVEGVVDNWNNMTQGVTSGLLAMNLPHVAKMLWKHDMDVGTALQQKQEIAAVFSRQFDLLTPDEKALAASHIDNSSFAGVREKFSREFNESFDAVRQMLDDEFEEMIDVGMKVGKTDDYFPRELLDYDKFLESKGVPPGKINKDFADAINAKLKLDGARRLKPSDMSEDMVRRHLSDVEVGRIVSRKAAMTDPLTTTAGSTDNVKSRSINTIEAGDLKYYADPRAALHNHINRVTVKIHDRRFFGGKALDEGSEGLDGPIPTDEELLTAYVKDYINLQAETGEISRKNIDKAIDLLTKRFVGSKRKAQNWVNNSKNIMYMMTLGNPIAASTQLGDVGAAAYLNGYKSGVNGLIESMQKGTKFEMKDFGLDAIPELESMGATRIALDWSLRWGGFKQMDKLGKETILNSTYHKLKSVIDDPKLDEAQKFQYFKDRYGKRLGDDEVDLIMDGMRSGDTSNPNVRLAMYSDLTRVQPISMSEMPAAYLNSPDLRIFYMLKTFTMKQIDLMRREVIDEIGEGIRTNNKAMIKKGTLNLGKIAGTIGLSNYGVEYAKQWLAGEDDANWDDAMIDTALRNYGLSSYTTGMILRGSPVSAAVNIITPPISALEAPIRGLFGTDTKGRWIDSFPPYGRAISFTNKAIEKHL